jgi:prepilin-type N-terminal cleavage/methylation domain-containing protein
MKHDTHPSRSSGFTIIELLVVIGIIVVLLGILLPVVNAIRKTAQKTDTTNEIGKLQISIHNYYNDFRAFPGPVPDSMIYGYNATAQTVTNIPAGSSPAGTAITMLTSSQNLTLGLLGGLSASGTVASPVFSYPNVTSTSNPGGLVNTGPQSLNPLTPTQINPYFDAGPSELSNNGAAIYKSCASYPAGSPPTNSAFSPVPEIMDHFSIPTPGNGGATTGNAIIYLRARPGSPGLVDNMTFPNGVTSTGIVTSPPSSQYYTMEMSPYWIGGTNVTPTVKTPGTCFPTQPDANNGNAVLYSTAASFFANSAINDGITPRSKDSFILISAGYDGIYGTSDDIVFSN